MKKEENKLEDYLLSTQEMEQLGGESIIKELGDINNTNTHQNCACTFNNYSMITNTNSVYMCGCYCNLK